MHSLPVFSSIEKLQNLYGLKHQDYKRYGQYCSRKLARTRKSLNFTQQSNKSKFTHKVVDHQIAQEDLRYITIPLFAAERAWSCAMQIKQDTNVQDSTRPLVHLRKKLAKAARLAQEFETICAQVADPKTVLEAQAYAALMAAYSNLESKKLKAALEKFVRAQTVLESLLKIAASDDRAIFNSRIEQIKTNIRYCEYFEGKADGAVLKSQMKDVDDILKAKVDAVLGETSKSDDSSRSINWGGNAILLKNQRINLMILKSEELDLKYNESKANSPEEESENLLNELIVCYSEIESMVRSEISQLKSNAKRDVVVEKEESYLSELLQYNEYKKLLALLDRNESIANQLEKSLADQSSSGSNVSQRLSADHGLRRLRATKPDDLVNMYDRLYQITEDILKFSSKINDMNVLQMIEKKILYYRSKRALFRAEGFCILSQWAEAYVLLEAAREWAERANMELLAEECRGRALLVHARSCGGSSTSLSDSSPWSLPPPAEAVPCKPVLFDQAWNGVKYPAVSEPKKGLSSLFGLWR